MDISLRVYERCFGFSFAPEERRELYGLLDRRSRHVLRKIEKLNRAGLRRKTILQVFREAETECFGQPGFIWASEYYESLGIDIRASRLLKRRGMTLERLRRIRVPRTITATARRLIRRKAEAIEQYVEEWNNVEPRLPLVPGPVEALRAFVVFLLRGVVPVHDSVAEERDRIMESYRFEKEMFRHTRVVYADDVLDEYLALSRTYTRRLARRLFFWQGRTAGEAGA